jgi:glycosyltransferase involved in cell wall biosynthesis
MLQVMHNEPIISIVVPTFNRLLPLKRCISSVFNQTYQSWELIVVDDGSTDGTLNLLRVYALADKRVKYFKRPKNRRKGANACRNIGIENSNGEYVSFLDSDDEWAAERLENLVVFVLESKAKAIYSGATIKDHVSHRKRGSRSLRPGETAFDFVLSSSTFSQTSTLMVKAEFLNNTIFDELLQRHQDFDFFIKVSEVVNWTYFENYDVTVFWDRNPRKSCVDFNSCTIFYQSHVFRSNDKRIRINYLSYILESCAKLNPSIPALMFFKGELLREGVKLNTRQKFIVKFPMVFHRLYLLKKTLQWQ